MGQTYQTVLCLAPMAGITDWPMRVLCYRMGADYACSEMVSAIGYLCAKPGNDAYRRPAGPFTPKRTTPPARSLARTRP